VRAAKATILAGAAVLLLLVPWTALPRLVRMPRDLLLGVSDHARQPQITASASPGPVEVELVTAARAHERLWLIAAGPQPERDPNRWAAACDGGDAEACARVGALLAHQLLEPARGLALLRSACERGSAAGCFRAARVLASPLVPTHEPATAASWFARACISSAAFPEACSRAVEPKLLEASGASEAERLYRTFSLLDRGCGLGHSESCTRLAKDLEDAKEGLGEQPRLASYYGQRALEALRRATAPQPPADVAEAKRRLEESLSIPVATERAQRAIGGYLGERRLQAEDRERVHRPVELRASGRPCVVRCPALEADPDASSESAACVCRCLGEAGASDAPPQVVRACIEDAEARRWKRAAPDGGY